MREVGCKHKGTKQRELVEDTLRDLPWIESGLLVRDFWSAVDKARGHALMAKWVKMSCSKKMENKKISVRYQVGCNSSGNGRQNCVRDGSRKRMQQVM